jgi:hypothetical protein
MIVFQNDGVIDPIAFKAFGVNAKENNNPIGYFGTGLKYAIAVLLRTGHSITIYSGGMTYKFREESTMFRGQQFEFVYVNEERLSYTLDLGKNWEVWQAYRELRCNVIDEGGKVYEANQDFVPFNGDTTLIVVSGPEIDGTHRTANQIFLETKPILASSEVEIHEGSDRGHFYYRGIRAGRSDRQTLYKYNIKFDCELTEDRTIDSVYLNSLHLASLIASSNDKELISKILTANAAEFHEGSLDFDWQSVHNNASETFLKCIEELSEVRHFDVNRTALTVYRKRRNKTISPEPAELSEADRQMLQRAIGYAKEMGFDVGSYEIYIAKKLGKDVLGVAARETIYVGYDCFERGMRTLVHALVEEFIHLRYSVPDCSRQMQNLLFDKLLNFGSRLIGKDF